MKKEIRLIKLINGEEIIGKTDNKVNKDGYIRVENIVRIMILPPSAESGGQPMISFADYCPYAFPVGSGNDMSERKSKYFRSDQFLHPPMEVQDALEANYKELFSEIITPPKTNLIV